MTARFPDDRRAAASGWLRRAPRDAGDDGQLAAGLAEALREDQAAGLVKRAGREAWRSHHGQEHEQEAAP